LQPTRTISSPNTCSATAGGRAQEEEGQSQIASDHILASPKVKKIADGGGFQLEWKNQLGNDPCFYAKLLQI
jgi:hypothetical protein